MTTSAPESELLEVSEPYEVSVVEAAAAGALAGSEGDGEAAAAVRGGVREGMREGMLLRWFVLPLLAMTTTLTVGYLARTQLVLAPLLRPVLEREARRRGVDLYIGTIRPEGLASVRLEQVRARMWRGHYVLDTQLDAVDITPSITRLFEHGRLEPDTIELRGGQITLERRAVAAARPEAAREKGGASGDGGAVSGLAPMGPVQVVGRDVAIRLKAGAAFTSTRPLLVKRIEASIPLTGAPLPTELRAYGVLPDHTDFTLTSKPDRQTEGRRYRLEPQQATQLHHWFTDQVPFEMTTRGIEICSGCGEDVFQLEDISVRLPNFRQGIFIGAPMAVASWDGGRADLSMPDVAITSMHDDATGVRLNRARLMFDTEAGAHTGELDIRDRQGGVLQLSWLWDSPARLLSGALDAQRFSMRPLLAMLEADPYFERGDLSGSVRGSVDLRSMLVDFQTRLTLDDARALVPFVSHERMDVVKVRVDADTTADLRGRALYVNQGRVLLADNAPVRFSGALIDARKGWRFEADARAEGLDAERLRASLPVAISRPVADAKFAGTIGFHASASGHTAFPDGLKLNVDIKQDMQVLRDGSYADIRSLATGGAPFFPEHSGLSQPTSVFDWVSYESLPRHVPITLLSAEDARFFKHDGFDVAGLRRAMAHNLKVGRMERGGSTVTQQLIKNLYLSHQRTAVRKLQEAYLTWRIEEELSKERIFEIYMNIAEWGRDIRGLAQASHLYFGREPHELTVAETALLGTMLPGPKRFGGQLLKGYIASSRVTKFEHIMSNLRYFGIISSEEYYELVGRSLSGRFDDREYIICADDDTAPAGSISCQEIRAMDRL